jgi:hypothetical protein
MCCSELTNVEVVCAVFVAEGHALLALFCGAAYLRVAPPQKAEEPRNPAKRVIVSAKEI